MKKYVLFDLDGTLIDSSECIYLVYRILFERHGLTLPDGEGMRRFIGPPIEQTIGRYVEEENVKPLCIEFREIYKTIDLVKTNRLYDGIIDAVKKIKNSGKKVYVATSKNEPFALKILQGLGAYDVFDGVYGSRYDLGEKNRIKKAEIINALLEENGFLPQESILIGDTVYDVEGAKATNIDVAIVRYGFGKESDFVGEKIAFFADTPTDLVKKLEEYDG